MTAIIDRLSSALADRYRIERELGHGGMATVYLAHDLRHDRDVAIKVLRPDLAAELGAERFLAEVKITARLDHPHILTLIDSGNVDGMLFYVMPFVRGESLRARMSREKLIAVDDAVRIAQQVASALDYAHRQGIVHRDIKPENILLQEGEAILSDFGIALAARDAGGERLTGSGISLGTPSYMSPEQAAGDRNVDARSDIYALGAVTYEMLAGEPPVTGVTAQAIVAKLMTQRPTSLRVVRDTVPASVDAAVLRALAKAPTDRFATARDFSDALAGRQSLKAVPRRRTALVAAAALVLAAAIAGVVYWRRGTAASLAVADSPIRSLAVLPLDNYSADSTQEYFAEGMTDELTSDLATISRLRVTSRGSAMQFAGRNRPSTQVIAQKLNVDAFVEGSVTRVGDEVRINAQLIDARADKHIWSQTFERKSSDVLALQADLASAIAAAINVQLTPGEQSRLAAVPNVDPAAYDAYLKGRFFFNRPSDDNLKRAIGQFETAVRISPTFAPAYSGLSDAYLWAGYNEGFITASAAKPKARAAAEQAVKLDDNSAEAHTSLATFKLFYEFDWDGGEREFRRAIALNPNYAFAHDQFGMLLAFTGRYDEAIAEGKRAIILDPLSPQELVDASMAFIFKHDFAGAHDLTRRAGELDPTFFFPVMVEGWIDIDAGKPADGIAPIVKSRALGAPPFVTAYLAYARGASGDSAGAMAELDTLRKLAGNEPVLPFNLALVYLGLGDKARAIAYLEQALAADSQMLAWLGHDEMFDSLRSEPRFVALLKRLRFVG